MQTEQFQLHAEIEERHWWFVARRRIMGRLIAEVLPPGIWESTLAVDRELTRFCRGLCGDYAAYRRRRRDVA